MSVLLTFSVPAEDLHLGRAARTADVSVSLDPLIPLDTGLPAVRVRGADDAEFGAFEEAVRDIDTVSDLGVLDRYDDGRLYSISWSSPPADVFADLSGTDAHVLSADGDGDSWTFETRFRDDDDLSRFSERCRDADVPVEVTTVRRGEETAPDRHGLTDEQRETLLTALEAGFYDVPRRTTTAELAAELGISDQSLSERLRRAHATLVGNTLQ